MSPQGQSLRRSVETLIRSHGESFAVMRDGAVIATVRGMRGKDGKPWTFPHNADIRVDDVLQPTATENAYTVMFLDKSVVGDMVVNLSVSVESDHDRQRRAALQPPVQVTISSVYSSVVNIQSQLNHVTQQISTIDRADEAAKAELTALVAQLRDELIKAPAEQADVAETVAKRVEVLVEEAGKPKPDRELAEFSAASLLKAAQNLAAVLPTILPIADQIVDRVRLLLP